MNQRDEPRTTERSGQLSVTLETPERTPEQQPIALADTRGHPPTIALTESPQDPRIVRAEEGWAYIATHHWKRVGCSDPGCTAKVKKGKAHCHRVHDPKAPMREVESIMRVRACTNPDCLNRHQNPKWVHYHQGPTQDADTGRLTSESRKTIFHFHLWT